MSIRFSVELLIVLLLANVFTLEASRENVQLINNASTTSMTDSAMLNANENQLEPLKNQEFENKYDSGILDGIDKLRKEADSPGNSEDVSKSDPKGDGLRAFNSIVTI